MNNDITTNAALAANVNSTKSGKKGNSDESWFEAMANAWGTALDEQAARIQEKSAEVAAGFESPAQITELTAESLRMGFISNSSISVNTIEAGYGANLSADEQAFQSSLEQFGGTDSISQVAEVVFEPLDHINAEAAELADFAQSALESQNTLTPSEMVALTVRSQEFMFHSQLTANIANRTADGVQQLFRQQS